MTAVKLDRLRRHNRLDGKGPRCDHVYHYGDYVMSSCILRADHSGAHVFPEPADKPN